MEFPACRRMWVSQAATAFSYLEVAVSALNPRSVRLVVLLLTLSLLGFSQVGCSSGIFAKYEDPKTSGMKLYQQQNYTDAAASFRNAIRSDPRDYQSHYYLAV